MNQAKVVLDLGHSLWKGRSGRGNEVVIPHAIVEISNAQYLDIVQRAGRNMPKDIFRINGKSYAVGKSAESKGAFTKRTGAERYTPDYIGVAAMATIAHLYGSSNLEAEIFVSYPPGHNQYTDELTDAIFGIRDGEWFIENGKRDMRVIVNYVNPYDESTGSLMNVMLTTDGTQYQHQELKQAKLICIDIGGGTTDFTIMENGIVDYKDPHSEPRGINDAIRDFERAFRIRYKDETRGTMALSQERLRKALKNGEFNGGGKTLEAHEEAAQARNRVLNDILEILQSSFGGAFSYDAILLTGGGSALMFDAICDAIQHDNILLAEDLDSLHLANVRGGLKLWKLYDALGIS